MDLKEIRKNLGVSQIDMASAVGVSLNTYILWERNGANPNPENQLKLEEAIERLKARKK